MAGFPLSRRAFLALSGITALSAGCTVDAAVRADPGRGGSLDDVDHFVLLMQENRSFDQYFGMHAGVHGLRDPASTAAVRRVQQTHGDIAPFRMNTADKQFTGLALSDPAHSWSAQHTAWHDGALDRWSLAQGDPGRHPETVAAVMGYYTRAELPVHYALADAFTLCDNYFCSVLGPTAPNRLFWMTGSIDPRGLHGGPIVQPIENLQPGALSWTTFPERLEEAGITWKVYNHLPPERRSELTSTLRYFRAYQDPVSPLYRLGLAPRWPADFAHDVSEGRLPSVSWIIPSYPESEHPNWPPAGGAEMIMHVLTILVSKPAIWERTALIVSYDENGGFFDHVPPPTPPPGATDEYLPSPAGGTAQTPIGLGFRVPCLVISPYSRGGRVSSEVFDHTSQLRLLGKRFGVDVPHVSPWRRRVTGDMAGLLSPSNLTRPALALPTHAAAARLSKQSLARRAAELKQTH